MSLNNELMGIDRSRIFYSTACAFFTALFGVQTLG